MTSPGTCCASYRPPLQDQFEWTFPVEYKRYGFTRPLPEAAAVMEVIHRRPLDLYMPLHDSAFCGAYFYLSAEDAELQDDLAAALAAAGLPPHCGEPEMPYLQTCRTASSAPSVWPTTTTTTTPTAPTPRRSSPSGTSSDAYAEAIWDCFTLVAETPHFTSRASPTRGRRGSRGEAKLAASRRRRSSRAGCTSAT